MPRRREILSTVAPLGVLAFWAGLWMAQRRYPSDYDWRYMTISTLVYPERNPGGYAWAWGGVALCGLGGLFWVARLVQRGRARGSVPSGLWVLGAGYACMVGCAALSTRWLRLPRGHDLLALLAFLAICLGTVQLTFQALAERQHRRALGARGSGRVYAAVIAGAALLPLLLVSATQAYVSHALPQLPWVGLEWRARGVPMYLSFAFWEWATCLVLSAYTSALALFAF